MKILITEKQLRLLKEQKEVPNSGPAVLIAAAINRSTKGFGTDEEYFYQQISKIKDKNTLNLVIEILKNGFGKNFYEIINTEFDSEEKKIIKNILNSNNLNHIIVNNVISPDLDKSVPKSKSVDSFKGNIVNQPIPKGIKVEPSILTKKEDQIKKPKNLTDAIKNNLELRRKIVAATLIGEAGGEKDSRSMAAVLSVLKNRTKDDKIKMAEAALDPKDFSMWNDVPRTLEGISKKINNLMNHPRWSEAYNLVKKPIKDITHGATHYYVFKGSGNVKPYWKDKLRSTIYPAVVNPDRPINTVNPKKETPCKGTGCFLTIGKHLFGKTSF